MEEKYKSPDEICAERIVAFIRYAQQFDTPEDKITSLVEQTCDGYAKLLIAVGMRFKAYGAHDAASAIYSAAAQVMLWDMAPGDPSPDAEPDEVNIPYDHEVLPPPFLQDE